MVVEGKIVEALTGAGVGDAEEVLTGASPRGAGDADDDADGADTDKVTGNVLWNQSISTIKVSLSLLRYFLERRFVV